MEIRIAPAEPIVTVSLSWTEATRLVNGARFVRKLEPDVILDQFQALRSDLEAAMVAHDRQRVEFLYQADLA
jgi:hypothetical protein